MNANSNSRRSARNGSRRWRDHEDIDVIDMRSRRRCQFERSGMDPISIAVHLLAETGDSGEWDDGIDGDDDGGWAA